MYSHLSVFDLDHTLLKVNSSYKFGVYLYRHRFFSFSSLCFCLSYYARHKLLNMSMQDLHQNIFSKLFKGIAIEEIQKHVQAFLNLELPQLLYAPAIRKLKEAQKEGHYTVILSSSPHFLVEPIARHLRVNDWKSSLYTIDQQGQLTGISSIMEGQGKADYVQVLKQQLHIDTPSITVYTDSYLDLPVMNTAGNAVAVNPDRILRNICLKNGWEIL